MEAKAKLIDVTKDWKTQRFRLMFEVTNDIEHEIEKIADKDLRLRAVRWTEKRSLNANNYAWELMSHIAYKLRTTKEDVYEMALADAGVTDSIDGQAITIMLKKDIPISKLEGHWQAVDSDFEYVTYVKLKGSSEYNTEEMSNLIDYIVGIAKDLGIDTATPDEIERYKALWQN